ncbi:MAG: hypothetical protein IPK26_13835 [Planctomycetes bacterium]|nr:hypothetical protein [Planctomycetota bacterium]
MVAALESLPDVAEVTVLRGAACAHDARPELLIEVPHGATRARHFQNLRRVLVGEYPGDLQDFFFVNTDVGAPEVALRVCERLVTALPTTAAMVVRCLIPRTFVDCNRIIDTTTVAGTGGAGGITAGLHSWVRDPHDRDLLLARYAAYRRLATAAFTEVCGHGGLGLMLHSYAPRSVDVPVDDKIVEHLRAAYANDKVGSWALRAPVDLIADDPDGRRLASPVLFEQARSAFVAAGFEVAVDGAYHLHPITLAHEFAVRHAERTLCLELRRDLLVPEFTPFQEMFVDLAKVDAAAAPLAIAAAAVLRHERR